MQITTKFEVGQEVFTIRLQDHTEISCPTCEGKAYIRTRTGRLIRCGHCGAAGKVSVPSEASYVVIPLTVERIRIDHTLPGEDVSVSYRSRMRDVIYSASDYAEEDLFASHLEAEVARAIRIARERKNAEEAEQVDEVPEDPVAEAEPYNPDRVTYVTVELVLDPRVSRGTAEFYVKSDLTSFMAPRGFAGFKVLDVRNARED